MTRTVGEVHASLAQELGGASGLAARQEARDVIAAVLDVPRFWPTAHSAQVLTAEQEAAIEAAGTRLLLGMPLAYATRRAAFRTLSLFVDERVLIPRPETELLVDVVLDTTQRGGGTAIDVGTGSGCIALALATEGTFARVIGTEISPGALAVAEENAGRLRAQGALRATVEFRAGSYLAPCAGERADVIVSNPPYIARTEAAGLPALVRDWEPAVALFADDDGMAAIGVVASESVAVLAPGGLLALEVDSQRAERARDMVAALGAFRDVVVRPDLTGRARFVLARRVEE